MVFIDPGACFLWALLLLVLPLRWLLAAVAAAVVHELGHYLCLRILAGKPVRISVGISGIVMDVAGLSYWQEFLCTASGPAASLSLLLFGVSFPLLGFCGLVQGVYNLIPMYPMDGGRMLHALLCLWLPIHWAEHLCNWISVVLIGVLAALFAVSGLYSWLVLLVSVSILGLLRGKIPCKPTKLGLQ